LRRRRDELQLRSWHIIVVKPARNKSRTQLRRLRFGTPLVAHDGVVRVGHETVFYDRNEGEGCSDGENEQLGSKQWL